MTQKVVVVRREDGLGGAEAAARRITESLQNSFETYRIKAGYSEELKNNFGGKVGPGWFKCIDFSRKVNRWLQGNRSDLCVLSLERGVLADIYRAGDGVHQRFIDLKYPKGSLKKKVKPLNWVLPALEKKTLEDVKVIVANSSIVEKDLHQYYPNILAKISIVHNGVNPNNFYLDRNSSDNNSPFRKFLFVGHDWARKGLEATLRLCSAFKQKHGEMFALEVWGKGDSDGYKNLVSQLGLVDQIKFMGMSDNMRPIYNSADVLILPTQYDPFSNACLEALACGCAVVTTEFNGVVDILNSGETGMVWNKTNQENVIAFLKQLKDPRVISKSVEHLDDKAELKTIKSIIEELSQHG